MQIVDSGEKILQIRKPREKAINHGLLIPEFMFSVGGRGGKQETPFCQNNLGY